MDEVTQLRLGFVNAYLIGRDRFVLVDAGLPGMADRILSAVTSAGKDPGLISLILITHAHVDHYGSAAALKARLGVPVGCGVRDAADMEAGASRHLKPIGWSGRLAAMVRRLGPVLEPDPLTPDILFSGASSLERWGVDASVVPSAGHTPGSVAVVSGSFFETVWDSLPPDSAFSWAVVGDLVSGRFTAPLRPRLPFFASDPSALCASLSRFAVAETVYVGHGGPLHGLDLQDLVCHR